MNVLPVYETRFRESLRGLGGFFVIFVVVMGLSLLGVLSDGRFFMTGAYEMAAAVTLFVHGICSVREDMRLASQNGVGRRSAFLGAYLASMTLALILAVAGELLCVLFGWFSRHMDNVTVSTLYELIYQRSQMDFGQHMISVLFAFGLYVMGNFAGSLISLIYYRLNRFWKIALSVGAPILMFTVVPVLLVRMGAFNPRLLQLLIRVAASPVTLSGAFLLAALVSAALGWLLMRRAPIRAAK